MTTIHDRKIQAAGRREYVAPQFFNYGSVNDLTAGGSSSNSECQGNGKGSNGPCMP